MAKQELLQNWNGQQVLSNDHVPELETDAYMLEAQGFPRDAASQHVYQEYKRKHLIQSAAFHYKAMKAAQGMGANQEAQKHMITYGLCVQSLGLDPYGATPPEILAAAQDPNLQIAYKFQAHPADAFLLGGGGAAQAQTQPQGGGMNKHEIGHEIYKVLKKATEVLEGAAQPEKKEGPSPFQELEQKAQAAGKPADGAPAKGNAAPSQSPAGTPDPAVSSGEHKESKCGSCGASIPFSTTLEGDDNAMGAPGKIPGTPDFQATLPKAGTVPTVPFSTTLEGQDAAKLGKEEMPTFQPTNRFKIKLAKCEGCAKKEKGAFLKSEILHGIHEIGKELLMKMGAYDLANAQDGTNPQYFVQPQQQQHAYQHLAQHGWTPAQTSVGAAAMKPAAGGGVYSIHNIGSRHHVIHSDAEGNITPLGIHGDTRMAAGHDLALGAVAHHELMARGGQGQGQPGVQAQAPAQAPQALMRSEISEVQMKLAPIYKSIQPLTKHDLKHNIKISQAMGGQKFMDEQGNVYNTLGEAAERLGLQASHIQEVLHGKRDQANGHTFKFVQA
jgi:hypothetical protein